MTPMRNGLAASLVALASFALVGCSGGGARDDSDGGDGETSHVIAGTVNGLAAGQSVTLTDGRSRFTLNGNGPFSLITEQETGTTVRLLVAKGPPERDCLVGDGEIQIDEGNPSSVSVNCARIRNWVTDGSVRSTALSADGTRLFISGDFTRVSMPTGTAAVLDAQSGAPDLTFPTLRGTLRKAIADGRGGWYLAGEFGALNGRPATNLVHVLSDHSIDERFSAAAVEGSHVSALALSESTLFVSGHPAAGSGGSFLRALDSITGAVSWSRTVDGDVALTNDLLFDGESLLYVAGTFSAISGMQRHGFAALNALTGEVTAWNPASPGAQGLALASSDSRIFVSGSFRTFGGVARSGLASLDKRTREVTPWDPHCQGYVTTLAAAGATVYLGGDLYIVGGEQRTVVAAVDSTTGELQAWDPHFPAPDGPPDPVFALTSTTLYVADAFESVGGLPRKGIAGIDRETAAVTPWGAELANISQVASDGERVLVGGTNSFVAIGEARPGLAALDAASGVLLDWHPELSGGAGTLVVDGNTVIAATGSGVAFVDGTTGALASLVQVDTRVDAMALAGRTLYVAGSSVRAIDVDRMLVLPWQAPKPDFPIFCVAADESKVYIGGSFTAIGGTVRNGLAAFDRGTGQLAAWNPDARDQISSWPTVDRIILSGDTLYVGGSFQALGDTPANNVALISAATGQALAQWSAPSTLGDYELPLWLDETGLYVGWREGVAVLDAATGALRQDAGFTTDGLVVGLTLTSTTAYVNGGFQVAENVWRPGLAFVPR